MHLLADMRASVLRATIDAATFELNCGKPEDHNRVRALLADAHRLASDLEHELRPGPATNPLVRRSRHLVAHAQSGTNIITLRAV
jgi:predicted regulator of Ras-like GTPase activity (Roadblock/LC7/MglB family)